MTSLASVTTANPATAGSAASASTTGGAKAGAQPAEDRFLTLLVAQLKNQDPLSPMDNAQITSQMAQISTVGGIDKLNDTLKALSGQMTASGQVQSASLVGHRVLVSGSSLVLSEGVASGGFSLRQPVDQLTVTISDQAGIVMSRIDLGPRQAGMHTFAWDGMTDSGQQAVNGAYQFSVSAQAGDKKIETSPLALARVDAIRPGADGATLILGSYGEAPMADVKQIF